MTRQYRADKIALLAAWRDMCDRERDAVTLYDEAADLYQRMRDILEMRNATKDKRG